MFSAPMRRRTAGLSCWLPRPSSAPWPPTTPMTSVAGSSASSSSSSRSPRSAPSSRPAAHGVDAEQRLRQPEALASRAASSCPGPSEVDPARIHRRRRSRRTAASSAASSEADGARLRGLHAAPVVGHARGAVERVAIDRRATASSSRSTTSPRAARRCGARGEEGRGDVARALGRRREHARVHLDAGRDAEHRHRARRRRRGCRAPCRRRRRRGSGRRRGARARRPRRACRRPSSARARAGFAAAPRSRSACAAARSAPIAPAAATTAGRRAPALEPRQRPTRPLGGDAASAPSCVRAPAGPRRRRVPFSPTRPPMPAIGLTISPSAGATPSGLGSQLGRDLVDGLRARSATSSPTSSSVITNGGENEIVSAAGSARVIRPSSRQRAGDARADLERRDRTASAGSLPATNSSAADQRRAAHLADERMVVERLAEQRVQQRARAPPPARRGLRSRSGRGSPSRRRPRADAPSRCSRGRTGRSPSRRRARARRARRRCSPRAGSSRTSAPSRP